MNIKRTASTILITVCAILLCVATISLYISYKFYKTSNNTTVLQNQTGDVSENIDNNVYTKNILQPVWVFGEEYGLLYEIDPHSERGKYILSKIWPTGDGPKRIILSEEEHFDVCQIYNVVKSPKNDRIIVTRACGESAYFILLGLKPHPDPYSPIKSRVLTELKGNYRILYIDEDNMLYFEELKYDTRGNRLDSSFWKAPLSNLNNKTSINL